eukprot:107995-Hanusia_phi.AAC.1
MERLVEDAFAERDKSKLAVLDLLASMSPASSQTYIQTIVSWSLCVADSPDRAVPALSSMSALQAAQMR